jgi:hypothetical protein
MPKCLPAALRLPSSALTCGGASGDESCLFFFSVTPCLRGEKSPLIRVNPWPLYFPLNCAGRFSKNAVVPSFLSSEAQATPNSTASKYNPSAKVISMPLFTASIAY